MRFLIVLIFLFFSCQKSVTQPKKSALKMEKPDCNCIENYKKGETGLNNTKSVFIKNIKFTKKDGAERITGNCISAFRKILSDGNRSFERDEISCISEQTVNVFLDDSTKYYLFNDGDEADTGMAAKKFMLDKLTKDPGVILNIEVSPADNKAIMVQRAQNLEPK